MPATAATSKQLREQGKRQADALARTWTPAPGTSFVEVGGGEVGITVDDGKLMLTYMPIGAKAARMPLHIAETGVAILGA